jgi:CheY-like chemotaxis protein
MSAKKVPQDLPAELPLVLVVDADPDTRALYRCAFESQGYQVAEACDGRDALVKALSRPPAVVVTDTRLAHLDGYALCGILRKDRTTSAVPIVVVTSEAHLANQQRARNAGGNVVLIKPTQIDTIVDELRRLVDERQAATALVPGRPSPRGARSKSFARATIVATEPSPLGLRCPSCDNRLVLERSHVGGVNASEAERWDDYICASCGTFQYRHRTRKLTRRV